METIEHLSNYGININITELSHDLLRKLVYMRNGEVKTRS